MANCKQRRRFTNRFKVRKPFVIVKGKNPYFVVFDQKSRLLANQNNQNEYFGFPVIWRRLNLELLPKEKGYTNGLI